MLTGLTYQNAGDFLSRREKTKTLDNPLVNGVISSKPASTIATQRIQKTLIK